MLKPTSITLGSRYNEDNGNGNGNIRVLAYGMFWQWLAKFSGWHKRLIEQWKKKEKPQRHRTKATKKTAKKKKRLRESQPIFE